MQITDNYNPADFYPCKMLFQGAPFFARISASSAR